MLRKIIDRNVKGDEMPFNSSVRKEALVASGRCCCICHKFCGRKIEVHHIRQEADGGTNVSENAIPLCFDCHGDMGKLDTRHPKGTNYSESELKQHRDNWYAKVKGNIGIAANEVVVETDKQIYRKLVRVLPWKGSISFVRSNNFAGFTFNTDNLSELHDFEYLCENNPSFEFIDPDLESMRENLYGCVAEFTSIIATETFPANTVGWNSVVDEDEQPERFRRAVKEIHKTAANVTRAYAALVRTAARKLGVLPPDMD